MKIKVVRKDGSIETINLEGLLSLMDGGDEVQSCLGNHMGHDHFFNPDGTYDGWGMHVPPSVDMSLRDAAETIEHISAARVIEDPK